MYILSLSKRDVKNLLVIIKSLGINLQALITTQNFNEAFNKDAKLLPHPFQKLYILEPPPWCRETVLVDLDVISIVALFIIDSIT